MSAPTEERGASLWAIDATLHQLIELREEPGITDEERAAIDQQIIEWTAAEVEKVDRVRGFIRHCDRMEAAEMAMAEDAHREVDVHEQRAAMWQDRKQRMKDVCLALMEARGVKKLEGEQGRLRIQANGGKQKLNITREDLIPTILQKVTLKFTGKQWIKVAALLNSKGIGLLENPSQMVWEPDTEAIRAALERKCAKCGGTGRTERGMQLDAADPCSECNGTGHHLVPGAELAERGVSLRVE